MYYLLKTEPSDYSFSDLQRDKTTVWDGISNPVALRNPRDMPAGAKLAIYHTVARSKWLGLRPQSVLMPRIRRIHK